MRREISRWAAVREGEAEGEVEEGDAGRGGAESSVAKTERRICRR